MREGMGKYRGKRVDNGEWVYGYVVNMHHNDHRTHYHSFIIPFGADLSYGVKFEDIAVAVILETVGEHTGLQDKNGKEMYEGDITETDEGERFEVLFSEYEGSLCVLCVKDLKNGKIYDFDESLLSTTVSGNIHEGVQE